MIYGYRDVAARMLAVICLLGPGFLYAKPGSESENFSQHPKALKFIDDMAGEHGFDKAQLKIWMRSATKQQNIIDAISRPAEKTKPWHSYRDIFLKEERITLGAEFWREQQAQLQNVYERYGVPPEIIVAIIGVETYYGRHMGKHRVLDALTTLGFEYPPRGKFFARELESFLLLAREQNQDPLKLVGSYAGAMGYGQFIPSSYRAYARDGDDDGVIDIWSNKKDAITSVGFYFKAHGWQKDQPVVTPAKRLIRFEQKLLNKRKKPTVTVAEWKEMGFESLDSGFEDLKAIPLAFELANGETAYKLGFRNFYVITRYNHSRLYALAVWELSQAIKSRYQKEAVLNEPSI